MLLLREDKSCVDHKKLLISSASQLSPQSLIKYIKRDNNLVYQISPYVFEELIAEIFASNGFKVELTKRSQDGGKDIIAVKSDLEIPSTWIIECKRFDRKKVDVRLVRQLFGVKQAKGYDHAVLVTTSSFTEPALEFEREVWGLSLRDYNALTSWLRNYTFSESGGLFLSSKVIADDKIK